MMLRIRIIHQEYPFLFPFKDEKTGMRIFLFVKIALFIKGQKAKEREKR
jgi:hypothetical protein